MKSDEESLDWFQVLCVDDGAGNFHRVDGIARREGEYEVFQRVSLIVVHDCIAEVDRVGGAVAQRVKEVYVDVLAYRLDFGLALLRRGNDDFLAGILDFDVFVKFYRYLLPAHAGRALHGSALEHDRRLLVVRASVRTADVGARRCKQCYGSEARQSGDLFLHLFVGDALMSFAKIRQNGRPRAITRNESL